MIKAASLSLSFALVLTVAANAPAQTQSLGGGDTDTAVQEAVRRQAFTLQLHQKLADAQAAAARKDVAAAGKLYEAAYELTQKIGAGVDAETQAAAAGIVWVSIERARQAQERGDFRDAAVQIKSGLRVDPKNPFLLTMKKENDAKLESLAGKIPSVEMLERVPSIVTNKIKNNTLVQDGRLLYELGKWDEAEAKLKEAAAIDPANQGANYYLRLIEDARYSGSSRKRELEVGKRMVEIEDAWQRPVQRDVLPAPNAFARNNLINTGPGRQAIVSKLNRISLNDVKYDGLELSEVIKNLSDETRKRDPDKTGLNFLILPDTGSAPAGAPGAIDPSTGLPLSALPTEAVDVSTVRIKINPALSNVRLADVLDAIVRTAEKPIRYSVEDYAIVFSLKPNELPQLYTRTFKVDPNTFRQGLESVSGVIFGNIQTGSGGGGGGGGGGGSGQGESGAVVPRVRVAEVTGGSGGGSGQNGSGISFVTRTNSMESVQSAVRAFFIASGVDLTPPKAVFFNDRKGILFVRATLQDLDIIEAAIQTLNVTPPQINIKARIAEVNQNDSRALGFDWMLGNTTIGGAAGIQGGSAPQFAGQRSFANPLAAFPDASVVNNTAPGLLTSGLRNSAPAVATLTGILTQPQFRVVINALEQRGGTDLLSAPEVTTVSGRQAQISVTEIRTIVTGVNANQTASSSSGSGTTGGTGGSGAVGSTIQFTTQALPFGPTMDVIPYVSADEYSVQMTIIPTITEFVGYDELPQFKVQAQGSSGGQLSQTLPLPKMRTRQVTTSCVVWDGQTVVLGGLISEDIAKIKDKVPVLGDLPMVGRLFRSESTSMSKKNLLIFVTPTIIDPAGNRLHSDEEMPFAQNTIPAQHPAVGQP